MEPFAADARLQEQMPASEPSPAVIPARPPAELDLPEVVRRAQLGSHAAFESLALAYGARLHRFIALRVGPAADARDVLQETLVAAWRSLPSLQDAERFWPWLAGIAANKAADAHRRHRPTAELDPELAGASGVGGTLEVREALAALPPAMREVVLLRFLLRLSEAETAAALGVRVGTVKSRAARARRALEEALR
ncbi:MAG TPA: RNA polymerase sigma factor [Gaiellaceae bacterium]|nr:RNA polymerase sigma factor [Gaiellaceae bacterium]